MISMDKSFIVLLLVCIFGVVLGQQQQNATDNGTNYTITFDRVLIVLLENQPLKSSLKNKMMREVLEQGTLLVNYYGLVNPSQPNYIGLIGGDLMGVSGDGDYDVDGTNLVDLLEAKGISWKSYQENYPGDCFAGNFADGSLYKRKHNPFISFNNIRNNPERCAKIVEAGELSKDLEQGTVPQYSFYTPNMNNNGHDTGLDYAANWLKNIFLHNFLAPFNATGNSLMVVTFDEGVPGDNQIYTLLLGDKIPARHLDDTRYDHYSLLRLMEENFNLGSLNRNDASASQITKQAWRPGTPDYNDLNLPLLLGLLIPGVVLLAAAGVGVYLYRRKRARKNALSGYDSEKVTFANGASLGSHTFAASV